jgi:formylglycine-generating enzyme required for sulfatase activity
VHLSWSDADAFCKWLSKKEGETYELPTEAEWEYACRAGTETRYFNSDDPERLVDVASCREATLKSRFRDWKNTLRGNDGFVYTSPVGSFQPNAFGLYDMHGNVWEMCSDWYSKRTYERGADRISVDPKGAADGLQHVNRGGCFYCMPLFLRSAARSGAAEDTGAMNKGFRVVKRVKPE